MTGDADNRWIYHQAMSQELLKVAEHCLPLALVLFDDLLVVLESELCSGLANESQRRRVPRPRKFEPNNKLVNLPGILRLLDHIIEKHWHD